MAHKILSLKISVVCFFIYCYYPVYFWFGVAFFDDYRFDNIKRGNTR